MKTLFNKVFPANKRVIIGAVHFPPLLGYPDFPGFPTALKNALSDVKALEEGGADAIIFENNYDLPHRPEVLAGTIASMTYLGEKIRKATKLPVGISVLWNDYTTAFSIAKALNLQFIRIPVFVDKVRTECGIIEGDPKKVLAMRKSLGAEKIAIFTDVHVKHSKLLSHMNIVQSAKKAIAYGSDAIIVTGKWTGDSPDTKEMELLRNNIGKFPLLAGSGTDQKNIRSILAYCNGAIVSTSLKAGGAKKHETNVKGYRQRLSRSKVAALVKNARYSPR